jgi:hypothetical protein
MFLIGLNRNADDGPADLAILEKRLHHLKKQYRLVETARWPAGTPETTIRDALLQMVRDSRWTVRRKVFSQDRRPVKTVKTPPAVAVRFRESDTGRIDALRALEISVEGIAVTNAAAWRREDFSRLCLGNNYFVPGPDLRDCLSKVFSQGRLILPPSCSMTDAADPNPSEIDPSPLFHSGEAVPLNGLPLAVALPVWFSETIRKITRYGGI